MGIDAKHITSRTILLHNRVAGPQLRFLALTWSIDLHLEVYNMAIETSSNKILNKPCGLNQQNLPSGKCLQNYGKSPYLMGKPIANGHFQ